MTPFLTTFILLSLIFWIQSHFFGYLPQSRRKISLYTLDLSKQSLFFISLYFTIFDSETSYSPQNHFIMTDQNSPDKLHIGLTILSFIIPIVGIVIYFMNRNSLPNKAKTAGIAAIAGVVLGVVFNILMGAMG